MYRFERMEELISEAEKMDVEDAVSNLRNKKGLDEKEIGFGNEKALNQLLAHHGIVFKPESLQVWVSSSPYQLGEFVAYDLNEVFKDSSPKLHLSQPEFNVEADPFLYTEAYKNYESYRTLSTVLKEDINSGKNI